MCWVSPTGKFYCKPHYCYRLSGYAQRKRPAPSAAPVTAKVHIFIYLKKSWWKSGSGQKICSESAFISPIARLMLKSFVSYAGESDPPNSYYDCGCSWKGDGSSCPLG